MSEPPADLTSLLDREVWVVSAAYGPRRSALTATWVHPVSLPGAEPVFLLALQRWHCTTALALRSGWLVCHLLREDQVDLAWQMAATSGWQGDKLGDLPLDTAPSGAPLLSRCLAWAQCRIAAQCPFDDRWFLWGDVTHWRLVSPGQPLRQGAFFAALDPSRKRHLQAQLQRDVAVARRARQEFRNQMPPWLRWPQEELFRQLLPPVDR